MQDIILTSGEYTYYKNLAPEVGKIINVKPTGHGNDDLNPDIKDEYINNIQNAIDCKFNYKYIYNAIRTIVFDELFTKEIREFISNNASLKEPYQLIEANKSDELYTFMYELLIQMENETNKRIRTLGDFNSNLRRG